MRIIDASAKIISPVNWRQMLELIEQAGRTCYKSKAEQGFEGTENFVRKLIERGHESVLEHCSFTAKLVCDRGVTHELVRHRVASYSQESTRYCNYSGECFGHEITVIRPLFFEEGSEAWSAWYTAMGAAEKAYFALLDCGATAQEARGVLPHSTKAEIIMTANLREWRHFFDLRVSNSAHPQMREVAKMLLQDAHNKIPVVFDDIFDAHFYDES